ncbi:winged helix DNA-binding domain-containing protein [Streptomyces sp. WMMC500]|uniref:winged helix DNA-binding domain-containing protein n=1 Tax=Streptomyces sp. WMMC500 TaxID=3015154 RepID=UPI00248C4097|nr:winged helix DNA-binding domain-containing protein [Streptomyces sp. WMMC500]WBB62195.1 winged helix DNA-binding domain-containing protein [Streptomyces sp. WMMC500]
MTKTNGPVTLSTRRLNRALLARQLLLDRVDMPLTDAVAHLLGLQAQAPRPPYHALAARLRGFDPAALSALLESREVVRLVTLRSTVHLHTPADALTLRPFSAPALERELRTFRGRLQGVDLDRLTALTRELAEPGPVSLREIGDELRREWPEHDPLALKVAARILLPLVQVPPRGLWGRGGQVAHATARSWLGAEPAADPDVAPLVLRYLAAFGPASVRDMQAWCGVTRLRPHFEALRPRLRTFRDERGTELFDLPDAPRPAADTPAPARFLGEFDNLTLAHADRTRVVSDEFRRRGYRRDHAFGGFLVDGFVRGLWRVTRDDGAATMHLETFAPLTRGERPGVEAEAAGVLEMLAPGSRQELRIADAGGG